MQQGRAGGGYDQAVYKYTHGGYGLLIAYALVAAGVLAGLIRSRALGSLHIAWPLVTVPTLGAEAYTAPLRKTPAVQARPT